MTDGPLTSSRSFPLVPIVWVLWIVIYFLMMWHGGWQWGGAQT